MRFVDREELGLPSDLPCQIVIGKRTTVDAFIVAENRHLLGDCGRAGHCFGYRGRFSRTPPGSGELSNRIRGFEKIFETDSLFAIH